MRILVLRATAEPLSGSAGPGDDPGNDTDTLVTHEITRDECGLEEVRRYVASGPKPFTLVVTSQTTVRVLLASSQAFDPGPVPVAVASGEATGRALLDAGLTDVRIPGRPGATGVLELLPHDLSGQSILWPRGSDASTELAAQLEARGASVSAPIVYTKRPLANLDVKTLGAFRRGEYGTVAVTSLAALDAFLHALGPGSWGASVRWGAIGPETARAFATRGLPGAVVPDRPLLVDLIRALRGKAIG